MSCRLPWIAILLLACVRLIWAQTPPPQSVTADTLAGKLPKVISREESPYIVVGDIEVPLGRTVLIEPGVVFLFNNFTGLKVFGNLLARGTGEAPIVFTSVNDSAYHPQSETPPAPYDWNGIHIYDDGVGSHLAYCAIYYSVYGVISTTPYIRIGPSIFSENGRANVTIEGVERKVVPGKPFEYALSINDAAKQGIPLTILRDPLAPRRNIFRYSGLTAFLGGTALAVVYAVRFTDSYRTLETYSSHNAENLAARSSVEWEDARSRALGDLLIFSGGALLGVAGGVGFTWSFTF